MAQLFLHDSMTVEYGKIVFMHDSMSVAPIQETIASDAYIISYGVQQSIDSLAFINNDITSDAHIKIVLSETINSDANIKVLGSQQEIASDAEIYPVGREYSLISSDASIKAIVEQIINSDAHIKATLAPIISSDAHIYVYGAPTITSDAYIRRVIEESISSNSYIAYHKDFYAKLRAQVDAQKDFNLQLKVNQPSPTDPTGLTATDTQNGESLLLSWTDTGNYGYNVYKDVSSTWVKQNETLIKTDSYVAGGLVTSVTYTFQVRGVNGLGIESSGVNTSGTPTYNIDRYTDPDFKIYISGTPRDDAVLERVGLVYGPAFSTASFYIPKNPSTAGLPEANRQEVKVEINDRLVFTGILIKRSKTYDSQHLRVSYMAIDKLWEKTLHPVGIDVKRPTEWPKDLWNPVNVADLTELEFMENSLKYKGNYKIHTDAFGNISYYKLGSPISQRTFEIGKHILRTNLDRDLTNPAKVITVYSDPMQKTIHSPWKSMKEYKAVWDFGLQKTVNKWVDSPNKMQVFRKQLSDIEVYARIDEKPQPTGYISSIEVLPGHLRDIFGGYKFTLSDVVYPETWETDKEYKERVEKGINIPSKYFYEDDEEYKERREKAIEEAAVKFKSNWGDGGSEGRFPLARWREFTTKWVSVSSAIEYAEDGNSAIITVNPIPKSWHTNIESGTAIFKVKKGDEDEEVEEIKLPIKIWNEPYWMMAEMVIVYTYKGDRLSKSSGSGIASRTYHENIVPVEIDVPDSIPYKYVSQTNITEVNSYLQARAESESARHLEDADKATMTILGDETLTLRTQVNGLEVLRVTHDFTTSGFLTHLDLTTKSHYAAVVILRRKEMLERKNKGNVNAGYISVVDYDIEKIEAIVGEQKSDQGKNPTAGIAHYSD